MVLKVYAQADIEAIVAACGVQPHANYVVMHRYISYAKLMARVLTVRMAAEEYSREAQEDDTLLIFQRGGILAVNLAQGPDKSDGQWHPVSYPKAEISGMTTDDANDRVWLRFEVLRKRQEYYFLRQQPPAMGYLFTNFAQLRQSAFRGLAEPNDVAVLPTLSRPQPAKQSTRRETKQSAAPTRHEDVAAEYRPERQPARGLKQWFGGPKRS